MIIDLAHQAAARRRAAPPGPRPAAPAAALLLRSERLRAAAWSPRERPRAVGHAGLIRPDGPAQALAGAPAEADLAWSPDGGTLATDLRSAP
jgi:hypothetical protein